MSRFLAWGEHYAWDMMWTCVLLCVGRPSGLFRWDSSRGFVWDSECWCDSELHFTSSSRSNASHANCYMPFPRHGKLKIPLPHKRVPRRCEYPVSPRTRPPQSLIYRSRATKSSKPCSLTKVSRTNRHIQFLHKPVPHRPGYLEPRVKSEESPRPTHKCLSLLRRWAHLVLWLFWCIGASRLQFSYHVKAEHSTQRHDRYTQCLSRLSPLERCNCCGHPLWDRETQSIRMFEQVKQVNCQRTEYERKLINLSMKNIF